MKKNKYSFSTIYYPTPKSKDGGFYISPKSIKWFLVFVVVGLIVYFIYFSGFFTLKNIIFEGEKTDELLTEINKLKGKNLLFISPVEEEKLVLEKLSNYKTINFYKGLPDSIKIRGELRKRALIWNAQGKHYSVDSRGFLYEEVKDFTSDGTFIVIEDKKNLPVILGTRIVSYDFVDFVKNVQENFSLVTSQKIVNMAIEESTYHIYISTDAPWKVVLTLDRPVNDQLEDLKLILNKSKDNIHEYVDLRIAGRAYYK